MKERGKHKEREREEGGKEVGGGWGACGEEGEGKEGGKKRYDTWSVKEDSKTYMNYKMVLSQQSSVYEFWKRKY